MSYTTEQEAAPPPGSYSCGSPLSSLHDCLALGQPELALAQTPVGSEEARVRLPSLLRLLAQSRPRTAVPNMFAADAAAAPDDTAEAATTKDDDETASSSFDPVVEEAVRRLEDRAVQYRQAEAVQTVSCYLAPVVTKALGRLPPLHKQQQQQNGGGSSYDTTALAQFVAHPVVLTGSAATSSSSSHQQQSSTKNRKRRSSTGSLVGTTATATTTGAANNHTDDEDDDGMNMTQETLQDDGDDAHTKSNKRPRRTSADLAVDAAREQDSPEFAASRAVSELARLTLESLQRQNVTGARFSEDSILATRSSSNDNNMMSMEATVASILPFAPVLRHRHVATALCRANIPQAHTLIAHMGANCPAAVPSLLVGCLRTILVTGSGGSSSGSSSNPSSSTNAKSSAGGMKAMHRLAELSPRERARALALLRRRQRQEQQQQQQNSSGKNNGAQLLLLQKLELELLLPQGDAVAVACFLVEHLPPLATTETTTSSSTSADPLISTETLAPPPPPPPSSRRRKIAAGAEEEDRDDNPTAAATNATAATINTPKSLCDVLHERPDLLGQTLECFTNDCLNKTNWGRIHLILKACTWLLARVSLQRLADRDNYLKLVAWQDTLLRLLEGLRKNTTQLPSGTSWDNENSTRSLSLLASAIVSTVASLVSLENEELKQKLEPESKQLMTELFAFIPQVSQSTRVLLGRIALAINTYDLRSLCDVMETVLSANSTKFSAMGVRDEGWMKRLSKFCDWAQSQNVIDAAATYEGPFVLDDAVVDPSLVLQLLQVEDHALAIRLLQSDGVSRFDTTATVQKLLKEVLGEEKSSLAFLQSPKAAAFVELGTSHLFNGEGPKVPLVLPIQIERQAKKLKLSEFSDCTGQLSLFLVQLLYCFVVLELEPESPFNFDPRVLPLKEAYDLCETSLRKTNDAFCLKLKTLMNRHCTEVRRAQRVLAMSRTYERQSCSAAPRSTEVVAIVKNAAELMKLLRKSVAEPEKDPCGLMAEKAFLEARKFFCDAALFTVTTSALLSKPHSPAAYFTYPILYRDPLIILKCPVSIWNRRGTRRIALVILMSLLDTNEHLLRQRAQCDETRDEFLTCRNELVVRGLLSVASSSSVRLDGSNYSCGLTSGSIRQLVARQRGLASLLIKQNLPDIQLDWMIEYVPELMEDASALASVLAERTSLTMAERLVAADGVLRIVIAHGHRDISASETLAYAALSQLIVSFFLTIGPVGVPVNALVGDGQLDATQTSRKATFRMLKALQKVRGYRVRLRNECVLSLQKFAGMCKEGMVGNIQSAVTNRQKTLMKELLDTAIRALDAMGASV